MTDLTEEQITAGWLPHDGGPCPVNPLSSVEIMLRGGEVSIWNEAGHIVWQYDSPIGEIGGTGLPYICEVIAYRLPDKAAAPNIPIQDHLEQLNLTGAQCEGVMRLFAPAVGALATLIYEITHLSPCQPDGSHICKISGDALKNARAALKRIKP